MNQGSIIIIFWIQHSTLNLIIRTPRLLASVFIWTRPIVISLLRSMIILQSFVQSMSPIRSVWSIIIITRLGLRPHKWWCINDQHSRFGKLTYFLLSQSMRSCSLHQYHKRLGILMTNEIFIMLIGMYIWNKCWQFSLIIEICHNQHYPSKTADILLNLFIRSLHSLVQDFLYDAR